MSGKLPWTLFSVSKKGVSNYCDIWPQIIKKIVLLKISHKSIWRWVDNLLKANLITNCGNIYSPTRVIELYVFQVGFSAHSFMFLPPYSALSVVLWVDFWTKGTWTSSYCLRLNISRIPSRLVTLIEINPSFKILKI